MDAIELIFSFGITWTVILIPPITLRAFNGMPFLNRAAIGISASLWVINVILFSVLESENKSHLVLVLGAFVAYQILKWQNKPSVAEQRKQLGYD